MQLLLGCGNRRDKLLYTTGQQEWDNLVTIDFDVNCNPDIIFDLTSLSTGDKLPFEDASCSEIHAYDVLEHLGKQGDFVGFFTEFNEYHRLLKPGGTMHIIVPKHDSVWALGDPGHTRVMPLEMFAYLDQDFYKQIGTTSASDYRGWWKNNLKLVYTSFDAHRTLLILQKDTNAGKQIQDGIRGNNLSD